jgi:hypothetical protein
LFDNERLFDFSFYLADGVVGTSIGDDDWAKLYKSVKLICNSPEKRSRESDSSAIEWTSIGETAEYDVKLARRVFDRIVERSLEISIKPNTK